MKLSRSLERRYYDPAMTPFPENHSKRSAPLKKKVPFSATDSRKLRAAELKRRRKAEKRNLDRAVIIGATA